MYLCAIDLESNDTKFNEKQMIDICKTVLISCSDQIQIHKGIKW